MFPFRKLQGFLDAFFILSKQTLGLVWNLKHTYFSFWPMISLIYGMLFVFVCVKWCPTHIVLFFFDRLQWKKLVTNTVKLFIYKLKLYVASFSRLSFYDCVLIKVSTSKGKKLTKKFLISFEITSTLLDIVNQKLLNKR
jgi:hypothetical protein